MVFVTSVFGQTNEKMARKLSNFLVSEKHIPFQFNYDANIGPDKEGISYSLGIEPLIPFSVNDNWYIISRTIFPLVTQNNVFPEAGRQTELRVISQHIFDSIPYNSDRMGVGCRT